MHLKNIKLVTHWRLFILSPQLIERSSAAGTGKVVFCEDDLTKLQVASNFVFISEPHNLIHKKCACVLVKPTRDTIRCNTNYLSITTRLKVHIEIKTSHRYVYFLNLSFACQLVSKWKTCSCRSKMNIQFTKKQTIICSLLLQMYNNNDTPTKTDYISYIYKENNLAHISLKRGRVYSECGLHAIPEKCFCQRPDTRYSADPLPEWSTWTPATSRRRRLIITTSPHTINGSMLIATRNKLAHTPPHQDTIHYTLRTNISSIQTRQLRNPMQSYLHTIDEQPQHIAVILSMINLPHRSLDANTQKK